MRAELPRVVGQPRKFWIERVEEKRWRTAFFALILKAGAGFLTLGDKDENRLAAAAYLITGIPLVVYGIINALDTPEYVLTGTPNEGPF